MAYPREKLPARFRNLALMEAVNALLLPALLIGILGRGEVSPANLVGAGVLAVSLLTGAAYWWQKLRQLRTNAPLPNGMALFNVMAKLGWVTSIGGTAAVIALGWGDGWRAWVPGLLMALLAIAEQVNYFVVQLSHDNRYDLERLHRAGFRRAKLARDLDAWRATERSDTTSGYGR